MRSLSAWLFFLAVWSSAGVRDYEVPILDVDDDAVPIFDVDDDDAPVFVFPDKEQQEATAWFSTLEVDSDFAALPEMPRDCSTGELHLNGTYKVTEEKHINFGDAKHCNVTSDGASLLLEERILFRGDVTFSGRLSVQGRAELQGACVEVWDDCTVAHGAELRVENCSNMYWGSGGGVYVGEHLHVDGALEVHQSRSRRDGGGVFVYGYDLHLRGKMNITGCTAGEEGGAVYVGGGLTQSGGNLTISDSHAGRDGGAIWVDESVNMSGGNLSISNSTAHRGGGVFAADASLQDGSLTLSDCHSKEDGGGIYLKGDLNVSNASVTFSDLTAARASALVAQHLNQVGGNMTVDNCTASAEIIVVASKWEMTEGYFGVHRSSSPTSLFGAASARFTSTTIVVSDCEDANGIFTLGTKAVVRDVVLSSTNSTTPQIRATAADVKNFTISGSEAWVSSSNATFQSIDCDPEFGGVFGERGAQCKTCPAGLVFRKNRSEVTLLNRSFFQECVKCPNYTQSCTGSRIEMQRGVMLDQNISKAVHCPNGFACPGGVLSDIKSEQNMTMCAQGYEGLGCSTCLADYARADSNPFICLKCAEAVWWKVVHAFLFVAGDVVVFAASIATVMNAQGKNKNSAVYLNQLMSFSAVAAPALMALEQTKTFRDVLEKPLWALVTLGSLPVQASDAGDSSTAVAAECLLGYMNLEPSMLRAHALSSCVYLLLGLISAMASGPRVAIVVSVNCFLAKFCSAFGKYLICYRMETGGQLQCMMDEPYFVPGAVACAVAILFCFAVGPGAWYWMTQDKGRRNEPSVLYLTRSYQEGCEHWEVERLVRKMLLKLLSVCFPITLNPASQMVSINLVLMVSLLLHAKNRPYVKAQWNNMEAALLVAAQCTVALTTLTLANETHWARSEPMQVLLILGIMGLIMVAGGVSTAQLGHELYRERMPDEQATQEADREPKSNPEQ